MRTPIRLLLATALGAAVLVPATSAQAQYCGAAQIACSALCSVERLAGGYCLL